MLAELMREKRRAWKTTKHFENLEGFTIDSKGLFQPCGNRELTFPPFNLRRRSRGTELSAPAKTGKPSKEKRILSYARRHQDSFLQFVSGEKKEEERKKTCSPSFPI